MSTELSRKQIPCFHRLKQSVIRQETWAFWELFFPPELFFIAQIDIYVSRGSEKLSEKYRDE